MLKKSNLLTGDASKVGVDTNNYKNGRITQPGLLGMIAKSNTPVEGVRVFVSGEKLWLTAIDVKEKEVSFYLFTDAYSDVRYRCKLNFPIEKGSTPTVSGMLAKVAEVFDIQQDTPGGQPGKAPAPTVSEAPPPPNCAATCRSEGS